MFHRHPRNQVEQRDPKCIVSLMCVFVPKYIIQELFLGRNTQNNELTRCYCILWSSESEVFVVFSSF